MVFSLVLALTLTAEPQPTSPTEQESMLLSRIDRDLLSIVPEGFTVKLRSGNGSMELNGFFWSEDAMSLFVRVPAALQLFEEARHARNLGATMTLAALGVVIAGGVVSMVGSLTSVLLMSIVGLAVMGVGLVVEVIGALISSGSMEKLFLAIDTYNHGLLGRQVPVAPVSTREIVPAVKVLTF